MEGIGLSSVESLQAFLIVLLPVAAEVVVVSHREEEGAYGILEVGIVLEHAYQLRIFGSTAAIGQVAHDGKRIQTSLRRQVLQGLRYFHHRTFARTVSEVDVGNDAERERLILLCPHAVSQHQRQESEE